MRRSSDLVSQPIEPLDQVFKLLGITYLFEVVMSRRCAANLGKFGKSDPVFVQYTSSNAGFVRYIVCINGRVPERY